MTLRFFASIFMLFALCGCSNRGSNNTSNDLEQSENCEFNATYNTMQEAEDKLLNLLEEKYGHRDSLFIRYRTYEELIDFVLKEPRTMDYPFTRLQEETDVNVITSEDGNLRLYYWDNSTGGTCIGWSNICQYRSNGEVYAYNKSIVDIEYGTFYSKAEGNDNNCAILGIKTIYDTQNSPIYLVNTYFRESSNLAYTGIDAVKIEDGRLLPAPIFRGEIDDDETNSNETEICAQRCFRGTEHTIADWYFRTNDGEGWDWLCQYDDKSNNLYIPQAEPDITDRYSLYHFDGTMLSYIGTDGGFWLHPTLRSFRYLEWMFTTKDYRIRIDRMFDGTYRYASWSNRGAMDKAPDIIIYNGFYDEQNSRYIFKHNGYEYIVENEDSLIVRHRGKTILSQIAQPHKQS